MVGDTREGLGQRQRGDGGYQREIRWWGTWRAGLGEGLLGQTVGRQGVLGAGGWVKMWGPQRDEAMVGEIAEGLRKIEWADEGCSGETR